MPLVSLSSYLLYIDKEYDDANKKKIPYNNRTKYILEDKVPITRQKFVIIDIYLLNEISFIYAKQRNNKQK